MDWNQNKLGYYADFAIAPLVVLVALAIFYHGGIAVLGLFALAGFFGWTFAEYWIHRVVFHHVFQAAHHLHHRRPRGYVAAPVWLTTAVHLVLAAAFTQCGPAGLGLLLGLEAGYLAYIVTHDRMHHSKPRSGWLYGRAQLHAMHHHGAEANFGVITSLWDRVFRTYLRASPGC